MSNWVALTEVEVADALPTNLAVAYAAWVAAHPEKEGRLGELTLEVVATCRAAVQAGSPAALDPDETKVPTSGFRHMINTAMFNLGVEMNFEFAQNIYSLVTRADIWLRGVQVGSVVIPTADGALPSPSYEPPNESERALNA